MKSGVIFGLILVSTIFAGFVVSAEENSTRFVTETITCKFIDINTGELCYLKGW